MTRVITIKHLKVLKMKDFKVLGFWRFDITVRVLALPVVVRSGAWRFSAQTYCSARLSDHPVQQLKYLLSIHTCRNFLLIPGNLLWAGTIIKKAWPPVSKGGDR